MINIDLMGFTILPKLSDQEFAYIFHSVERCYSETLGRIFDTEEIYKFSDYKEISKKLNHSKIWTKVARCLPKDCVSQIERQTWLLRLQDQMGNFTVSDEEGLGYGNIYFRLVRENQQDDVGPFHADAWFWEISGIQTKKRLKIWIPLETSGESPFLYIPGSHLHNRYSYRTIERHGSLKPEIINVPHSSEIHRFGSNCGVPILFHDKLIHGGSVSRSGTRVSIEFTLVMKNEEF
jgi:hypothetical protein